MSAQRPLVVGLSGSSCFIERMAVAAWEEEKAGHICRVTCCQAGTCRSLTTEPSTKVQGSLPRWMSCTFVRSILLMRFSSSTWAAISVSRRGVRSLMRKPPGKRVRYLEEVPRG